MTVTEIDEKKGLVRTYWKDIRARVAAADPIFAGLVDELNPGKDYPLYLAYYDYGALTGDTISAFIPNADGSYYRLSDPHVSDDIKKDLGYGLGACPFGMVLEKNLEYFIDLKNKGVTAPWCICKPGFLFPLTRILSRQSSRIYAPNGLLSTTAGARSTFMLANIGSEDHHVRLRSEYNVRSRAPKKLYNHFQVFKEIANNAVLTKQATPWRACLLYFSEPWVNSLLNSIAWTRLLLHIHAIAWQRTQYERMHIQYDVMASLIQQQTGLKPNPYIADTACHLLSLAFGAMPGYAPATNDDFLPLELLQQAYVDVYNLDKYAPCIMEPTEFLFEQKGPPVYYSLKYPSTLIFSPKAIREPTVLHELQELEHVVSIFLRELREPETIGSDTIFGEIAQKCLFDYYHNEVDPLKTAQLSGVIPTQDSRFNEFSQNIRYTEKFPSDSTFFRGCIRITRKRE